MSRFGPITPEQKAQLAKVVPSHDRLLEIRPCRVLLKDGTKLERVYIVEAAAYLKSWGIWPEDDFGKRRISVEEVGVIEDSAFRLPPRLADKLYKAGETGMGYFVYTVVLADGTMVPCLTGSAVDFPRLPHGVMGNEIVDVIWARGNPEWRDRAPTADETQPEYVWCLYAEDSPG